MAGETFSHDIRPSNDELQIPTVARAFVKYAFSRTSEDGETLRQVLSDERMTALINHAANGD